MPSLEDAQYTPGQTLRGTLRDYSTGAEKIWNGSAFETYSAGNILTYPLIATEGIPGTYAVGIPSALAASASGFPYRMLLHRQAGTAFAPGDLPSSVWKWRFAWDGSKEIDEATLAAIASASGTGTYAVTVNVKNANTAANIVGATVRVSGSQAAGPTTTDTNGNANLSLNAGTVMLGARADGFSDYANAALVVTGAGTINITLAAVSLPSPGAANQAVGYLYTRDHAGAILASQPVKFKMILTPDGHTGNAFGGEIYTRTSDSDGLLSDDFQIGAKYEIWTAKEGRPAADGAHVSFVVPAAGPFTLPDIYGVYA